MTKTPMPAVTDHALLRYLERVRGFSLARERSQIADICRGVVDGSVKFQGHDFIVKDGRVITVQPSGSPSRTMRERAEAMG